MESTLTNGRRTNGGELNEFLSKFAHLIFQTLHEPDNTKFGGRVVGEPVPAEQTEVRCDCNDVTCLVVNQIRIKLESD